MGSILYFHLSNTQNYFHSRVILITNVKRKLYSQSFFQELAFSGNDSDKDAFLDTIILNSSNIVPIVIYPTTTHNLHLEPHPLSCT